MTPPRGFSGPAQVRQTTRGAKLKRLLATAFHEAGHAVVGTVLGARPMALTTRPDGSGDCDREPLLSDDDLERLSYSGLREELTVRIEREMLSSVAGQVAQRIHRPSSVRWWQFRDDYRKVEELLLRQCGSPEDVGRQSDELERMAERLLRKHWTAVERVALALASKGHLPADAVAQLMSTVEAETPVLYDLEGRT